MSWAGPLARVFSCKLINEPAYIHTHTLHTRTHSDKKGDETDCYGCSCYYCCCYRYNCQPARSKLTGLIHYSPFAHDSADASRLVINGLKMAARLVR